MIVITFIEPDNTRKTVEADPGLSVMEVAIRHNVQGIAADCGGQCSCATCHVHVADAFFTKVGPPADDEEDLLEFSENRQATSRLACQIEVSEELDGLCVHVVGEAS